MSISADEARVARIQKYKEERRKQLTARTATLFSTNVTERRSKNSSRTPLEDTADNQKSSSELNLNTASTSVPIRTTRTSRLRAAAANNTESCQPNRKSKRSSSAQSLVDDDKFRASKNSKLIDRDKTKTTSNRRQSHEKENLRSASTTCYSEKDNGAIKTKLKHSINKTVLEKDKLNYLVSSPKHKNVDQQISSKTEDIIKIKPATVDAQNSKKTPTTKPTIDGILNFNDSKICDLQKDKFDEIYNNLVVDDKNIPNIHLNLLDDSLLSQDKNHEILNIPVNKELLVFNDVRNQNLKLEKSVVPNVVKNEINLLGAVCVRKVERFSELLSNLCSPCEADILFEDILVENGIHVPNDVRAKAPECTPPCRRTQPVPRTAATTKQPPATTAEVDGTATGTKYQRSSDTRHLKQESLERSLENQHKSPSSLVFGFKSVCNKLSSTNQLRSPEKRRISDIGNKPSCIPLSRKTPETKIRNSTSLVKQDLIKEPKYDNNKSKIESTTVRTVRRSPEKLKNDTDSNRKIKLQKAQKDTKSPDKNYHNSKKRLTSLDNSPRDVNNSKIRPSKPILNENLETQPPYHYQLEKENCTSTMSALHETPRPHASSRLSQEMDSLVALTKQTLDRVNKLSNNSTSNKIKTNTPGLHSEHSLALNSDRKLNSQSHSNGVENEKFIPNRGVTERLNDIDMAAQRLIDFEKQSAMFNDLGNESSSQSRRLDNSSTSYHTPVSILKRKSINEETNVTNSPNHVISSPPVTFSPSVIETHNSRCGNRRQGILKKRRSLDESQVARRRSCSPEVSFAEDGNSDLCKSILKNRRSSLEDVIRNRSPDGQIQGILKRKMSKEEEHTTDDVSHGSPEPHGILKRKSNSSSSSSTTSSHVSIAQAVLLAAAGGAEIVDEDKEIVRPILKKKSFSEERPCPVVVPSDTPKPILKKKSTEFEEPDFELPKRPILKSSKKLSMDDGHTSSLDLSEDDRSSRRPSLLRSRTSDHSSSECETTVKPILKQRGSSLSRERSQSPRPRLSFCADADMKISTTNFSNGAGDLAAAGPLRVVNGEIEKEESYPSAVITRRNLRPKPNPRSMSLLCDVNDELLSILNDRRLKVDQNCRNGRTQSSDNNFTCEENNANTFPSIASRIKTMEQALTKENFLKNQPSTSKPKSRDKERHKTQPVTVDEMRSITSSLEPSQPSFQAYATAACSFPSRPVESGAALPIKGIYTSESERDPFVGVNSPSLGPVHSESLYTNGGLASSDGDADRVGEATFLDFEKLACYGETKQSTLDEIEQEVNKVRVALDEDSRALDEDDNHQADGDNWSLNVSCDSGVYNRASSRDSGPHSGEELGLIECQEIGGNHISNSSEDWSPTSIEQSLFKMERERKSTVNESFKSPENSNRDSDDESNDHSGFALGLVKSNSVVARASMWQQLQQQARGTPKPLIRHSRSKAKEGSSVTERFKTQDVALPVSEKTTEAVLPLLQSKSTANMLDRDDDAKLDEDDPAKMSLVEKMKMFNSKLTHKPPLAGLPRPREERVPRASRLRTMPVLASQVQEALEQNERLTKSLTHEDVPRNQDFQLKMELFRSASAKNTSLEHLLRHNAKFRSLDLDDDSSSERAQRMITPEVRGILKSGSTVDPSKPNILAKGESSEGLKDEGIDSSSEDESVSESSVSSSDKSCSSSASSDEIPGPKRRFQRKSTQLKPSRTESDITRVIKDPFPRKIPLPGANELKARLNQAKNQDGKVHTSLLGKLGRKVSEDGRGEDVDKTNCRKAVKPSEPIQLGKLRRPLEKAPSTDEKPPVLKISSLNQAAKNKFFGLDTRSEKSVDELTAAVRKYIQPVGKSISTHAMEVTGSGSDGESSGGREVRQINTRRQRFGAGVQRSATHADMPNRGGTIAERLAALQAAGANDWRARVCRLSPDREDSKAIERAKNQINDSLNATVEEKKKVHIEENELGSNILAERRNKLETAAQGWRKRVPQSDASLFTVAGRLERDKVTTTPPLTPPPPLATPPTASPAVTPAVPPPNRFRSRKAPNSPTNGFASGPLRSASCAVMSAAIETKPKEAPRPDRESFKRSHSVSESISRVDEKEEPSGVEKSGSQVRVPRADDETFQAFFAPALEQQEKTLSADLDVDLDAIDSGSRQMLAGDWARRAKRERRHVASRNPLRALAARTDLRDEYRAQPLTTRDHMLKEKVTANCGLAAEALAALASKEDFSNVALRSASATNIPSQGTKALMLLQVKGRRRVQTRLVEPVHTNVNRGDCYLLVTPDQLFLYIGLYANVIERNRSTDIAQHIQNAKDLGCKSSTGVIKIDEQTKNFTNKHWNQFWSLLGVAEGVENYEPVETGPSEEDEIFESCVIQTNMCYEVFDDELVPIQEYWGQMPKIAMLNQSKVIVFDFGSEMYIWYGKNVPLESRRRAAQLAQELYDEGYNYEECQINPLSSASYQGLREGTDTSLKSGKDRPDWAILSKVTQHMETILFKEKFLDWPDYSRVIKVKPQENKSNSLEITPCDAEEMWSNEYQDPDLILEGSHVGRGTQYYDKESMRHYDIKTKSVCKWVIRENDYQKVENESDISEFFCGDSYIIRWEYQITVSGRELNGKPSKHNVTGRDRCAYFCWQGKDASSNEKGTAALLTVELDREKGPQVRVAQGNEPPAFLNLFQGKLVIHQGKKDTDKSRYRLFVTRGNVPNEAYLLQVPCSVRQLRSRGSLLLVDTETANMYIWHGARSLKHTKQIAIELANKLIARQSSYLFGNNVTNVKITEVKEGEESKGVLEGLGVTNKQYYNSVLSASKASGGDITPRLFHFTDLGGQFEANEVLSPLRHENLVTPFPFEQKELYSASQPALFMLDDGKYVWVWQGWWPRGEDGELEPAERSAGVGAFAARWQALRAAALRTADAYWPLSRSHAQTKEPPKAAEGTDIQEPSQPSDPAAVCRSDVRVVAAGLEPQLFTDLFDTWSEHDEAAEANIAHGWKAGEHVCGARELARLSGRDALLPLAALQRRPLPDHVDPHHLERHLASPEFQEAFGMTKEEFLVLPAWKQTNMKKDIGLF